MSKNTPDMIQGTLDMLILKVLQPEPIPNTKDLRAIEAILEGCASGDSPLHHDV